MTVPGLGEYDNQNIFARILRGEIPSKRVFENEWAVAFHDINPQAAVHVLVIRGPGGSAVGTGSARLSAADQHGRSWWAGGAAFSCASVRRPPAWPDAEASGLIRSGA